MFENTPDSDLSSETGLTPRNIMSRSARTMRVKFPSIKNKATVYVESLLERDAALKLELDPNVLHYRSQPQVDTFYDDDGHPSRYTPDFAAELCDGRTLLIEVKPRIRLARPKVQARLGQIAVRYQERQIDFVIWSEDELRSYPQSENRRIIWANIRRPPEVSDAHAYLDQLRNDHLDSWQEACGCLGDKIAHWLLAMGHLTVDKNVLLSPTTPILNIGKGG